MATPFLEIKGLNAWYGESHVLHGVDFRVDEGEVVTLLGRNGAGRTTTMRAIMGLTETRAQGLRSRSRARRPSSLATHEGGARLGLELLPPRNAASSPA